MLVSGGVNLAPAPGYATVALPASRPSSHLPSYRTDAVRLASPLPRMTAVSSPGRAGALCAAALVVPILAKAQQPTANPGAPGTRIVGVAYDSVHMNPLVGAIVRLDGTEKQATTDRNGAFVLEGIPAGAFAIRLTHPLLDTLGLQIGTRPVQFPLAADGEITLATPSAETIVAGSCTPAQRRQWGPSMVLGRVLDADTDSAAVGTKVSIAWFETSITTGLRPTPRVREATVRPDGTYRICGLPARFEATLQGTRNGVTTAEVKIQMDGGPLVLQSLRIGSAATVQVAEGHDSTALQRSPSAGAGRGTAVAQPLRRGPASLMGRVVNAAGAPVKGARVDVVGTAGAALTNENGEFAVSNLPSGTQVLVARQLGFAPVEVNVELSARAPKRVEILMKDPARVLQPVLVKAAREEGLDKVGFNRRLKSGLGHFLTTEQIEERNPVYLSDLFRTMPGLRVTNNGGQMTVESSRGYGTCVNYYLDGSPWQSLYAGDLDQLVPPNEIAAVEVYNGSSTPAEFQQPGQSSCTSVVMWTRTRVAKRGR